METGIQEMQVPVSPFWEEPFIRQGVLYGLLSVADELAEFFLGNDRNAEFERLLPFGAASAAGQQVGGGFGNGPCGFSAVFGDQPLKVVPRLAERAGDDKGFAGQDTCRDFQKVGPV